MKLHEQAAVGHHMLLLLRSNAQLEHQVLDFQAVTRYQVLKPKVKAMLHPPAVAVRSDHSVSGER